MPPQKQKIIIGNWKSNKTTSEIDKWFRELHKKSAHLHDLPVKIILAVSHPHLYQIRELIKKYRLPIALAAQDISALGEGSFTGEVNGKQLKELADYVIIGHWERRKHLKESAKTLYTKVKEAHQHQLSVIFCVPKLYQNLPTGIDILAYEPVQAIGTGQALSPNEVEKIAKKFHHFHPKSKFCYGGSVNADNVSQFHRDTIDALLIGSASLEVTSFLKLIKNFS